MTETEKKALALVNEVRVLDGRDPVPLDIMTYQYGFIALLRAIEQHEAFRQEVSDAVEKLLAWRSIRSQGVIVDSVARFIIAKRDPLVEALGELADRNMEAEQAAETLRAAIEARGGRIVWEG